MRTISIRDNSQHCVTDSTIKPGAVLVLQLSEPALPKDAPCPAQDSVVTSPILALTLRFSSAGGIMHQVARGPSGPI